MKILNLLFVTAVLTQGCVTSHDRAIQEYNDNLSDDDYTPPQEDHHIARKFIQAFGTILSGAGQGMQGTMGSRTYHTTCYNYGYVVNCDTN